MDSEPAFTMTTEERSDTEVKAIGQMVRASHKFDSEQRLNDSATSTAGESSSNLSTPPGASIFTTGPTNLGTVTTGAKHGSLSANNPNFGRDLNTPLHHLNYGVRGGGLNAGENSASDADGGMPKQGVSFDSTGGGESLTTTRSVSQDLPEERSVSVNPFKWLAQIRLSLSWFYPSSSSPLDVDPETGAGPGPDATLGLGTPSFNSAPNGPYNRGNPKLKFIDVTSVKSIYEAACLFPKWVYHNLLLLRLPIMYSLRIVGGRGGVGVDSTSGTPSHGGYGECAYPPGFRGHQGTAGVFGAALNRYDFWETFIDSLLREWKIMNILSAILISAILATLQIPEAADNPITRSTALLSLICTVMSLLYGCIYIMRFGSMKSMYRSSMWDKEVRRTDTTTWWNVWVLLALPAVSISWSTLLFLMSILSFVWLTGPGNDPSLHAPLSTTAMLGPRVAVTGVLVLGLVVLVMIVKTFTRYGQECEMRVDVEMNLGMLGAVSVQVGEPEERGREMNERHRGRDGERGAHRRGGGAGRHAEEE